jgi:acyl-CoA synthetase (AMP-forming)/AMP-acid ligase II
VLGEAERGGHFCAQHVDREVEERRPRLAAVAERAGARLVELLQDETAEAFHDGWCSVGDMARRDDDGYIRLVDRKSNMIISGGENVYPSEVEAVIGSHPQVEDVAVIGLPDAKWGEAVCAVVVVRAGGALSEDAVVAWCRERMAGYKRPRSVVFMAAAEMPRTATGKILHRTLRERLAAKAEGR